MTKTKSKMPAKNNTALRLPTLVFSASAGLMEAMVIGNGVISKPTGRRRTKGVHPGRATVEPDCATPPTSSFSSDGGQSWGSQIDSLGGRTRRCLLFQAGVRRAKIPSREIGVEWCCWLGWNGAPDTIILIPAHSEPTADMFDEVVQVIGGAFISRIQKKSFRHVDEF